MKAICFDPVTGASGDMILAALFDLGADPDYVVKKIHSMNLTEFELEFQKKTGQDGIVHGFCQVTETHPDTILETASDSHHHHHHGHHHRRLREILEMIGNGDFSERAKDRAAAVFHRLAEAEGAVHGIPPKEVHFHEVGAVDSIVDIVGTCLALEQLEIESIYVSSFKIGHGTLVCEHGIMPIPAPATAKLLEGAIVERLDIQAELTTPTGAALLTTLSDGNWYDLQCRMLRVGTGHGRRQLTQRPNLLRAYLVELPASMEMVEVIECDIDDQTPEMTALIAEQLRRSGALDVAALPLIMKKGRPGIRLSVLSPFGLTDELTNEILGHSSSIGVRIQSTRRILLPREVITTETPWGEIQAKRIERPSGVEIVPEAEACRELADSANLPVRRVADWVRSWQNEHS